jgi:hypothetical protein
MRQPSLILMLVLTVVGCGQPRQPIVARDQAEGDRRELELRVIESFDAIRLPYPTASSHLIEVEVLAGPPELLGRVVTFPYDEWAMGGPPPERGEVVRTSPRRWVLGDGSSRGKPFAGWEDAK